MPIYNNSTFISYHLGCLHAYSFCIVIRFYLRHKGGALCEVLWLYLKARSAYDSHISLSRGPTCLFLLNCQPVDADLKLGRWMSVDLIRGPETDLGRCCLWMNQRVSLKRITLELSNPLMLRLYNLYFFSTFQLTLDVGFQMKHGMNVSLQYNYFISSFQNFQKAKYNCLKGKV